MNIPIHGFSPDDAIQEEYEMQALHHWDASKAEIASIVDQFGWNEVFTYLNTLKPKPEGSFRDRLDMTPDGRLTFDGLSIN